MKLIAFIVTLIELIIKIIEYLCGLKRHKKANRLRIAVVVLAVCTGLLTFTLLYHISR